MKPRESRDTSTAIALDLVREPSVSLRKEGMTRDAARRAVPNRIRRKARRTTQSFDSN